MRPQLFVLGALIGSALAATSFAGTPVTPPKAPLKVVTTHTPMTPEQTRTLWQAAQAKLKAAHFYNGPLNGDRTDDTLDALRAFQAHHRIPLTGHLDPVTRQALGI